MRRTTVLDLHNVKPGISVLQDTRECFWLWGQIYDNKSPNQNAADNRHLTSGGADISAGVEN